MWSVCVLEPRYALGKILHAVNVLGHVFRTRARCAEKDTIVASDYTRHEVMEGITGRYRWKRVGTAGSDSGDAQGSN